MIRIRIGETERELGNVDESWINQQINRRRADGQTVCVKVTVHEDNLNMVLSTSTCGANGGGGRPPRLREKEVFDLWNQRGLNDADFTGGNLVAFLKQLKRLL
ncbi:MAG: hypothetical protein KKI12_12840 [Proteobacteria bacterium]|nr:hypothetical protein [Pseudomonadota bacterium]MBU4289042.1 hypothetical protein [Pseudomonadota bacterium]MCG2757259.1 hypothetical protein [Desulfobacteraceae bacterium]